MPGDQQRDLIAEKGGGKKREGDGRAVGEPGRTLGREQGGQVRILSVFQTYHFEKAMFIGCMRSANATLELLLWDQNLLNASWGS